MRHKYITAAVFAISLQACAVNPGAPSVDVTSSDSTVQVVGGASITALRVQHTSGLNKLEEGDTAVFKTGTLAHFGKVKIGRQYTAASGKLCKQVNDFSSGEMIGIACRANKDLWYTRLNS